MRFCISKGIATLSYRILRAVKNRYGSTNEIGVFEMQDKGLVEVENPSMMLLSGPSEKRIRFLCGMYHGRLPPHHGGGAKSCNAYGLRYAAPYGDGAWITDVLPCFSRCSKSAPGILWAIWTVM